MSERDTVSVSFIERELTYVIMCVRVEERLFLPVPMSAKERSMSILHVQLKYESVIIKVVFQRVWRTRLGLITNYQGRQSHHNGREREGETFVWWVSGCVYNFP